MTTPAEGINYETADVTLNMTAVEFEAVFDVLQNFVNAVESGGFGPERDAPSFFDKARTIRGLKFTFKKN
jgi:hypothetical protein